MSEQSEHEPVVGVRGLRKRFGDQPVLQGIDLDVAPGEILVIMGGSGSGKSTLLKHMIGSATPDAGTVTLLGEELTAASRAKLNELRKRIGVLFQSGALFNSMTLRQNVALILEEHTDLPPETIEIVVTMKLELVGLRAHGDKYPAQISGGMKKRAGLARALALDPEVLFYDEPSAGLDPVTTAEIDALICRLSRQLGVTSVVVTHVMESAMRIADRIAMLEKGVLLRVGPRSEFERIASAAEEALDEPEKRIRQFVRGESTGPLTREGAEDSYAADLLGPAGSAVPATPSVHPTR